MAQSQASGDGDSVARLAQMGLELSDKLKSGDSGKLGINQLVGYACEAAVLNRLDQNTTYDFLNGQTPSQALAALKENKKELVQLLTAVDKAQTQMTDAEWASYSQRVKISGEAEAVKWLNNLHPPADSQK